MEKKELKEFIHYLTQSKNTSREQRFKVGELLARDYVLTINKPQSGINDIFNNTDQVDNPQIQQSKFAEAIKVIPKNEIDNKISSNYNHRDGVESNYISPKNIQQFLREYNQDEVLKYTCHLIDTDEVINDINERCKTERYDFFKHLLLIQSHFSELRNRFKRNDFSLSPNIITLINVYLSGRDFKGNLGLWSANKINVGWGCEEIKNWATKYQGVIPNPGRNIACKQKNTGWELTSAFLSETTGVRIKTFSELVIFFKSQFHIRYDNSLKSIIEFANQKWSNKDIIISFSNNNFNESVELFTDVDKLIQAYKKIIDICLMHKLPNEPVKIELSFYDDVGNMNTYFCVHHLNSKYKKTLKNAVERIGESQSKLIEKQINGLCDLYVEAEFSDNRCAILNLWDNSSKFSYNECSKNIVGVKYILKF